MEVRFHETVAAYHWAEEWWSFARGEKYGFATLIAADVGMSDPLLLLSALEEADSVAAQEVNEQGGMTYVAQVPVTSVSVRALAESIDEGATAEVTVSTDEVGRVVMIECVADARSYVPPLSEEGPGPSDDRVPAEDAEAPGDVATPPGREVTLTAVMTLTDFGVDVDVLMPTETTSMDDFPSPHDASGSREP